VPETSAGLLLSGEASDADGDELVTSGAAVPEVEDSGTTAEISDG
jgi:hypothetical protein